MPTPATIVLKNGKDHSLRRRHPWVFSGAIAHLKGEAAEGDAVRVEAADGELLGVGHFSGGGSIAVRMLDFGPAAELPTPAFWARKLREAYQLRQRLGLTGTAGTDVFRLVHAEGDGLPGLIIDVYGATAVVQAHSVGMYRARPDIAAALQAVFGNQLRAIYDKSAETVPASAVPEGAVNGYLLGQRTGQEHLVTENGHQFAIDWEAGQKTGFFIDQRDNRQLLARYAAGLRHLAPGGLLFTFSCSQVVSPELFEGAVLAAAIEAGRPARILHRLTQPADHPVSLFHPEGAYLKGLVLAVE